MRVLPTHGYFLFEDAKEQQIMKPSVPLGNLSDFLKRCGFRSDVVPSIGFRDVTYSGPVKPNAESQMADLPPLVRLALASSTVSGMAQAASASVTVLDLCGKV